MTATPKELLDNLMFVEESERLKDAGFISDVQFRDIQKELLIPKTSRNILIRIGFFVLGVLLFSSIFGFFSFIVFQFGTENYKVVLFVYALISLAISEFFAHNKYHQHGLDDVFILGFQGFLLCAVGFTFESSTATAVFMALFGIFCCIRYVHFLSALSGFIGIAGIFAVSILDGQVLDRVFLPIVLFLLAIGMYFAFLKLNQNPKLYLYKNVLLLLEVFSLILGYMSVNYLVVRELSEELLGVKVVSGEDIPFAPLFYVLTFLIPMLYLFYALKTRNRTMLVLFLLAFAFSIFTIRFYYSALPVELALIFGGIAVFAVAVFAIKKLKHKETGITFERARYADTKALTYAQTIIANSHVGHAKQEFPPESPMKFGGGGFSGGGSSESF